MKIFLKPSSRSEHFSAKATFSYPLRSKDITVTNCSSLGTSNHRLFLKRLLNDIRAVLLVHEVRRYALLIAGDILISVLDILFLASLIFVIHFYAEPRQAQQLEFLPGFLFNKNSLLLITLFLVLFALKNFFGFLIHRAQSRFIGDVATRLSRDKLTEYLEGTYENYVNIDSAVHVRRISHQPIDFAQHILGGVQQIITQSVLILVTIVVLVAFDARILLFLFLVLLPPVIGVFYLIKGRLRSVKQHSQVSIEKSWQHLREALSGYIESNIYHKNDFFVRRYIRHQKDFNHYVSELLTIQGIPARMIEMFALIGLFFVVAISRWTSGTENSIITIGTFIAAAYKIIPGIVKIINTSGQINHYAYTVPNLRSRHRRFPRPKPSHSPILSFRLNDVSFQYNGTRLFQNINIDIEQGDFVGISGCSGTGKTTMLNLILGFLTPVSGDISMNKKLSDPSKLNDYWQHISYVRQEPFLLHDTIARNIILDNPLDETRLGEVIRIAGLDELVSHFPERHDKIILENGKNISGGQRQRMSIARALYKNADLVLLDEPFNELDEVSEHQFLRHFKQLARQGKIIILITHNKDSFAYCNKMISLDEHKQ